MNDTTKANSPQYQQVMNAILELMTIRPEVTLESPEGFLLDCLSDAIEKYEQRYWPMPDDAPQIPVDPAGVPKLAATFLEKQMVAALNTVKAWRDSEAGTPFPGEAREMIEVLLMTYELRRRA